MGKKIGVLLTLDGEQKFTQSLKNAQLSAKALKSVESKYKNRTNS